MNFLRYIEKIAHFSFNSVLKEKEEENSCDQIRLLANISNHNLVYTNQNKIK